MNNKIAYCGIDCGACEAYIATQEDDAELRIKVAAAWSKEFRSEISPADINCNGCKSEEGQIFLYSAVCEIRRCARQLGLGNCAHCPEYSCMRTEELYRIAPEAQLRLDKIKKQL